MVLAVAVLALPGNDMGRPLTPQPVDPLGTVEVSPPNEPARPNALDPPRAEPGEVGARARIYVPRLHLASLVYAAADVDRGPAWWSRTGRPGGGDTVAIAGHRTTHSRPFYWLETLRPRDRVFVAYRGRTTEYRVTGSRVLPATDLHIADARGREVLILSACTPRGSARYRLVVYARPV